LALYCLECFAITSTPDNNPPFAEQIQALELCYNILLNRSHNCDNKFAIIFFFFFFKLLPSEKFIVFQHSNIVHYIIYCTICIDWAIQICKILSIENYIHYKLILWLYRNGNTCTWVGEPYQNFSYYRKLLSHKLSQKNIQLI
jgi:hypothetical protein